MTRNLLFTACLTLLVLTSCKKDDVELSKSDYIIFGHFYGECMGEQCVEIFRLEQEKLFETPKTNIQTETNFMTETMFNFHNKFNDTKDLTNYFPTDLLNETDTVIGQPDAGDWGGLYVEYNSDEVRKYWLLDQKKSNVPSKYHNFIDKVNEKIDQLK